MSAVVATSGEGSSVPVVELTPTQQRTLDALRLVGDPPEFDADDIAEIADEMRATLADVAARLDPDSTLFVSKHRIGSVLDCEEFHLVDRGFEWTPANAAGTIAHRAIQLTLNWRGEVVPGDLVDEAMTRLADEARGIGEWIDGLSPADDADTRGHAINRVTGFLSDFPPLSRRWHPMTETSIRWPVAGPIVLSGKVDLVFGRPEGRRSRKVVIDLKTGRPSLRHRQDLGFYALVETLIRSVPPRRVATFYLDAGEAQVEDVGIPFLRSALRRTVDGIHALVEVELERRPPIRRPGVACRWCPLADDCDDGTAWLAAADTY